MSPALNMEISIWAIIIGFIIITIVRASKKNKPYYKSTYSPPIKSQEIETEIIMCSNKDCQQKLRIPKSDKKLTITCSTCNKSFSYSSPTAVQEKVVKNTIPNDVRTEIKKPKQIKIIKSIRSSLQFFIHIDLYGTTFMLFFCQK